jgi:two-component system, LytTR family, sensor kinase
MAAFELSPVFVLAPNRFPVNPGIAFLYLSITAYIIWLINIYVISIWKPYRNRRNIEWYALSYLFIILLFAFIWIVSHIFPIFDQQTNRPSVLFPIVNILTLNAIILIITNAIIVRSKKNMVEKELAELKIQKLEADQQTLIQQMQPHFLFNALSTLNSIIGVDIGLAKKYVVKLSNFLRFTISAHERAIIPLSDELSFAQDYIDLQQMRFEDSFFCTFAIPAETINLYDIPVYALQTLVENAIKHNAFSAAKPLYLSIVFNDECLSVSNNKMAKPTTFASDGKGVGLSNLQKRYVMTTGTPMTIEDKEDEFVVTLPLIRK